MAGSRAEWQRMCRACYGRVRARVRWDAVRRALTAYSLLARALLSAQARAAEPVRMRAAPRTATKTKI